MWQQRRLRLEGADLELSVAGDFPQIKGGVQHPLPVQGEHRVQSAWKGVNRQGSGLLRTQEPRPEQGVQVSAVVGVAVADEDCVETVSCR